MEPQEAIRIGYYTALAGNLTLDGNPVSVYSEGAVPEGAQEPYVIITSYNDSQRFTDRCNIPEAYQLLDIVTASQSPSGFGDAHNIAAQVEAIINPASRVDIDITAYGWRIGNTFRDSSSTLSGKFETKYVYRVLKRYRHLLSRIPES